MTSLPASAAETAIIPSNRATQAPDQSSAAERRKAPAPVAPPSARERLAILVERNRTSLLYAAIVVGTLLLVILVSVGLALASASHIG